MDPAIILSGVTKTFLVPIEKVDSLREKFLTFKFTAKTRTLRALDGVNLEINHGEWLGIIGPNGSGKSTLLKLIAGIYEPDQGRVAVRGRLVPFLELGVGFNPDLSAQDNIFLNGVILGMSRRKIREEFQRIVSFAGIKRFINQKLKNFSTGMQVRLAFSIAIRSAGDIFLLDEVLAVGDWQFRQKAGAVFRRMRRERKTVIIVSHELDRIKEYCDRVLWLEKGRIKSLGKPGQIIAQYTRVKPSST